MPDNASEKNPVSSNLGNKDQDEDLFLLEDSPLGKLYFIFRNNLVFLFLYGFFYQFWLVISFMICYMDRKLLWKWSRFFKYAVPPLSIPVISFIVHYVAFFWFDQAVIPDSVLIHLLKEVELQSSRHSYLNWCQIAYSVNEFSQEVKGPVPRFFCGDHCMKYFKRHVVGVVMSGTYKVGSALCGPAFGSKKSQRELVERSVESYQRIAEVFQKV